MYPGLLEKPFEVCATGGTTEGEFLAAFLEGMALDQ
jgi:hypothetical protein